MVSLAKKTLCMCQLLDGRATCSWKSRTKTKPQHYAVSSTGEKSTTLEGFDPWSVVHSTLQAELRMLRNLSPQRPDAESPNAASRLAITTTAAAATAASLQRVEQQQQLLLLLQWLALLLLLRLQQQQLLQLLQLLQQRLLRRRLLLLRLLLLLY